MVKIISDEKYNDQWNKVAVNPMQSWQWGEAKKKTGVDLIRIGEFEKNKLISGFQITFHKIPYTNFTVGYLPRSVIPSKEVIDLITQEAKKRNCIFVKIEPYIQKSKVKNQISKPYLKTSHFIKTSQDKQNFRKPFLTIFNYFQQVTTKSSHPLFPEWTQMIDLTKPEEELLKNMKPKTRYNIRLAQKHGVNVKEMTNQQSFEIFSRLYFDTCKRQGYEGHTPAYQQIIFDSLKKEIAHIFIAFYRGIPICAYEIFLFNNVIYYPYGGSSSQYKNVMAPNLLMWEAIKFGKKKGAIIFDMWGSLPKDYDPKDRWVGFTRFKEGYGGEYIQMIGSYDLVLNSVLYTAYGYINKLRKKLLLKN